MYKTIIAVSALLMSSPVCFAQAPMPSTPIWERWEIAPVIGSLNTLPFQDLTLEPRNDKFLLNWRLSELALRLSNLYRGASLKSAIQCINISGGAEDGGVQTIPATRYYFNPGINVVIPEKNGVLTGPLLIFPGSFHCD